MKNKIMLTYCPMNCIYKFNLKDWDNKSTGIYRCSRFKNKRLVIDNEYHPFTIALPGCSMMSISEKAVKVIKLFIDNEEIKTKDEKTNKFSGQCISSVMYVNASTCFSTSNATIITGSACMPIQPSKPWPRK